jgi:neuroblastoma-amplified sequence
MRRRISEMASPSQTYTQWTTLQDSELTIENVRESLETIQDDLWVAAACVDRLVDDVEVQRTLLELGLERTRSAIATAKEALAFPLDQGKPGDNESAGSGVKVEKDSLVSYFRTVTADTQLCHMRAVLLERLDRLNTFVEMCKNLPAEEEETEEALDSWEDDPWGEESGESSTSATTSNKKSSVQPPMPISAFLVDDLLQMSCLLASREHYAALRVLFERHGSYLWAYRFTLLDNIPEHSHPSEYRDFLPSLDVTTNSELVFISQAWRSEPDWSETFGVRSAIEASGVTLRVDLPSQTSSEHGKPHPDPLTLSQLTAWYKDRVDHIIISTGMVDMALATIQHGASQGIPDLDELGEELSLLSRLVYDAPQAEGRDIDDDWTLVRWRAMDPAAVIRAYLAHSSPMIIARDIRKLVMPYLFVLESRAERSGQPDPALPNRLLYDFILSVPLQIAAAIFEASKPTFPAAQRLIRSDEDIARLALACLYGSQRLDEWVTMSRIFECLPAWDISRGDDEADEADTTIASLGAFVTPSTSHPRCTASDLLVFFKPLPVSSLSRALDILDVHLEGGEILGRWGVPAPLRWFLQSSGDAVEQRAWANRMARRAGGSKDHLDTREDWEWLLKDMLKLSGTGENGLKGAFGLIPRKEVMGIFFGGLLSNGSKCFVVVHGCLV